MRMLATELTFSLAHVRNQNEKEVRTLIKKNTQSECKQRKCKINVNKKKINKIYFYFHFFHFCLSFYFLSYHISDSLSYLSHQIITAKHKISCIDCSKKIFKNSADQFHAAQAVNHHIILIARNKIKKTSEWINANEKKQKSIMNHVKKNVIYERENHNLSDKKYKQF